MNAAPKAIPDDIEERLARGRYLAALGHDDEAYVSYLDILSREPAHFHALHELGCLAHLNGYRSAARTIYRKIIACWPQDLVGQVNLGIILYEDGDRPAARLHFERALDMDPESAEAHRGLGRICEDDGDGKAAIAHWRRSFPGQAVVTQLRRGNGAAIPLLMLVSTKDGNIPTRHIIDGRFAVSTLYAEHYRADLPLPAHALLFNTIGDSERCADALKIAQQVASRSGAPLVNDPAQVLLTGRAANAARLAELEGVRVPRILALSRSELEARSDLTFPLLLRSQGFHTGQYFERVQGPHQLAQTASRLPGETLLAIEYLDGRGSDGLARKYRVMCIEAKLYPVHLAISSDWKVHYFTADMGMDAAHRAEEERFLCDMPTVLGPRAMNALSQIASVLGLDYAGIDFGLAKDGSVLFFEANATMLLAPPSQEPIWDYRRRPIGRAMHAARQLLLTRAAGQEHTCCHSSGTWCIAS